MTLPEGFVYNQGHDQCEDHIGPFYYREAETGREYAFLAESHHENVTGTVHGGVLMSFADYVLCMEATDNYREEDCVTVSFSCDFVSAAAIGEVVYGEATVTRKTGSLAFVTGRIFTAEETVFTYSSVVKRLR